MPNTDEIAPLVRQLLEEIRSASNSLLILINSHDLDLKMGLDEVGRPLRELRDLQVTHSEEVRRIVPHFSPKLKEAGNALAQANAEAMRRKRPDLDTLSQQLIALLVSLDESTQVVELTGAD